MRSATLKRSTPPPDRLGADPAEDRALFLEATQGAVRVAHDLHPSLLQRPKPAPVPRQRLADEADALEQSRLSDFTPDTLLDSDEGLSFARNGISADTLRKLRKGHWSLRAELDLHGMRTDEARETLSAFIKDCFKRDLRCLRVVHGKGLGSIGREPVLKNKVRSWLMQKEEVLAFCQAAAHEGGSWALMVLLRSNA